MPNKPEPRNRYHWRDHIDIVDSSLSQKAIDNIDKVDSQMLVHINDLQDRVQQNLTKFQPVIVAEFTPDGGKFTLLHSTETNLGKLSSLFATLALGYNQN